MHIHIPTTTFKEIIDLISRVSTKHATLPILQCVLIETDGDTIRLRGTNLEIGIEGTIPVKVTTPGSVAVAASVLLQTVSLITQDEFELEVHDDVAHIKTKTSKTTIATQNPQDFPQIPHIDGEGQKIHGKNFAYGIKTAAFAAAQNAIKPELGSVYIFQKKEQTLTFVATDSFRLVEKTLSMPSVILSQGILIPARNALEIARIADVFTVDPTITINENQCVLTWPNIMVTTRLIAGTFPDYQQIIPKEFSTHVTLLVQDLVNTLKKTSIFLNKFSQLTVSVASGMLTLASKGDVGTTEEGITVAQEGGDITLSLNQRYIQDILGNITDDSLTIHFTGIGRPIVIEGVYDKSLRYLVMPMNR